MTQEQGHAGQPSQTSQQIMDTAQRLVQMRGYHAFSYADISEDIGIRKASVHYHFASKSRLVCALVARYRVVFAEKRQVLDRCATCAEEALRGFSLIFRAIVRDGGRICLCASLAVDPEVMPDPVMAEVRAFYQENEAWLARTLEEGRRQGELRFFGPATVQAQGFMAGLNGAMQAARIHGDVRRYCAIAHQMLASLGVPITEQEISDPE